MSRRRASWITREWLNLRREIMHRDGFRCLRCDEVFEDRFLSPHHLMPRAEGGPDIPENLVTLCHPCHDLVEIFNLRTPADIIGSMPDPPPLPREWSTALARDNEQSDEDRIARIPGMTLYGILYEDYYHCLACGHASDSLTRYNLVFEKDGKQVQGFAILCRPCLVHVKSDQPASIQDIIGPIKASRLNRETSPYIEIVDHDYWVLFMRPAWLSDEALETRKMGYRAVRAAPGSVTK